MFTPDQFKFRLPNENPTTFEEVATNQRAIALWANNLPFPQVQRYDRNLSPVLSIPAVPTTVGLELFPVADLPNGYVAPGEGLFISEIDINYTVVPGSTGTAFLIAPSMDLSSVYSTAAVSVTATSGSYQQNVRVRGYCRIYPQDNHFKPGLLFTKVGAAVNVNAISARHDFFPSGLWDEMDPSTPIPLVS